ncbi:MAG: D-2-hydroxyacid dehydrogenase [Bacteroidota bacterium]
MNLVILDAHTSNPGDLSWKSIEKLADTKIYDRSNLDVVYERAKDAEIILLNKTGLNRKAIESLPKLKYIGVLATGYNTVDIDAASEKGIIVSNIPTYSTNSVVQMVFAHILNFTQRVAQHDATVKAGRWVNSIDFCYWDQPLIELAGKTLGIIGGGTIGSAVAAVGKAFAMEVLIYTPREKKHLKESYSLVSLNEVIKNSDVLTLHCPLNDETEKMINAESLRMMKKNALLINTGRGLLIDEQALAEALNNDIIAGAGLDVLSTEPPKENNPLLSAKNCYITPHNAWATKEARARLIEIATHNVKSYLEGDPQNVINPEVLSK